MNGRSSRFCETLNVIADFLLRGIQHHEYLDAGPPQWGAIPLFCLDRLLDERTA